MAEQLAKKKYLAYKLDELLSKKASFLKFLKDTHTVECKSEKLLSNPSYLPLLTSFFKPKSNALLEWVNTPFEKNIKYPEHLIHKSVSSNLVRSKSEAMIDSALFLNHIPFRYECLLQLGELSFYPDFTILHPITEEIFYWEHFGKMDHPSYAKNVFQKLELYNSHSIIPSINLITTFETAAAPFTFYQAEELIRSYFT